jgi:peptidylprolyl isomerase
VLKGRCVQMLAASACAGLAVIGCGGGGAPLPGSSRAAAPRGGIVANRGGPGPVVRLARGAPPKQTVVRSLRAGRGAIARVGYEAFIRYVGVHWDGRPYSNSWSYEAPPGFLLGAHELTIGDLERGIEGMRVGGRRKIVLPPSAHIHSGLSGSRREAREETLVYIVDLVGLHPELRKLRRIRALTGG